MPHFFHYLLLPIRAIVYAPRYLLRLSLPARVALFVALFLVICIVTAYGAFYFSQNRTPWELWWRPGRLTLLGFLLIAIPSVVYQALRLWLEGEVSRYPDIDYAWRAGVAELAKNGLDLSEIPIFLILGSASDAQERALFNATRLSFRVKTWPQGPAALHWFANTEGIYIFCSEVGQLSKLVAIEAKADDAPLGVPAAGADGGDAIRGTIVASVEPDASAAAGLSGMLPHQAPAKFDVKGTMMIDQSLDIGALVSRIAQSVISVSPQEALEQQHRLEYFCRLVRRARQALCPINGVLTLLPYGVIQRGARESAEVERAVKADLSTLLRCLRLRCPVTALVVGLDREKGFRELVRRLGPDRARGQRFGKGFSVWNDPLPEQLEAVCAHACGAFEDWVYTLFREAGGLKQAGNAQLYALLCKVRRSVQSHLKDILIGGYAREEDAPSAPDPLLFGGCYFAAVGDGEDRHAFVQSVVEKLREQQEELEWTAEALRIEQRNRRLALVFWAVNCLLLLALGGIAFYKFWGKGR